MSKGHVKGTKRSGRANTVTGKSNKATIVKAESDEAETVRLQLLAEVGQVEEAPGQLDALLDRAYLADSFFEDHVLQDPACLGSPELFREAWMVARALADFYQRVGQEVGKEPIASPPAGNATGTRPSSACPAPR
jgi:hypothetical protein